MSEIYIVMFETEDQYEKHKAEVLEGGGIIKEDYGKAMRGFAAYIPPNVLTTMTAPSLHDNGISSLERDSTVTIQDQ